MDSVAVTLQIPNNHTTSLFQSISNSNQALSKTCKAVLSSVLPVNTEFLVITMTSTYLNAKNVTNAAPRQTMLKMQPKYVISDNVN